MKPPQSIGPQNFLPGTGQHHHVGVVPARVVEVPAPVAPVPASDRSKATLLVRLPNRVALSRALVEQIDESKRRPGETRSNQVIKFEKGSPVELVPPARRGGVWHLDTRPTAGRRLSWPANTSAQFATSHHLKPEHFLRPVGFDSSQNGDRSIHKTGGKWVVGSRLYFTLGPEVGGEPGYYTLLPV